MKQALEKLHNDRKVLAHLLEKARTGLVFQDDKNANFNCVKPYTYKAEQERKDQIQAKEFQQKAGRNCSELVRS